MRIDRIKFLCSDFADFEVHGENEIDTCYFVLHGTPKFKIVDCLPIDNSSSGVNFYLEVSETLGL